MDAPGTTDEAARDSRFAAADLWRTGPGRVALLTGALGAVALTLTATQVLRAPAPAGGVTVSWFVLLPLFAGAEVFVVHLQIRRHAHSISLMEIPLVVGLVFSHPVGIVAARVLGAGGTLALHRRQRGLKLWFNVAHLTLEASLAITVYRALLGDNPPLGPWGWLAAFGAMLVTDAYSSLVITAAISLIEGRFDRHALAEVLSSGVIAALTNTSLALVAVLVLHQDLPCRAHADRARHDPVPRLPRLRIAVGRLRPPGAAVRLHRDSRPVAALRVGDPGAARRDDQGAAQRDRRTRGPAGSGAAAAPRSRRRRCAHVLDDSPRRAVRGGLAHARGQPSSWRARPQRRARATPDKSRIGETAWPHRCTASAGSSESCWSRTVSAR